MFKTILVPAGGAETDTPVFETALAVARLSAAHLVFLHIRVDVRDVIASMAAGDLGASGVGMGSLIDEMEADATKFQAAAKSAVEAFCAREKIPMAEAPTAGTGAAQGVTAEWRTEIGRLSDSISAYARATDLMVAGRSPSRAGGGGEGVDVPRPRGRKDGPRAPVRPPALVLRFGGGGDHSPPLGLDGGVAQGAQGGGQGRGVGAQEAAVEGEEAGEGEGGRVAGRAVSEHQVGVEG